tara:strand:+ start:35355 stop:38054 length:2700 start_codon:yes stop_codon:yes gene_type:complete
MSIIFKGDVISNFGTFLPAPYIREIDLTDDALNVTMSVFINVTDEQDVDSMINDLSNKINLGLYLTVDKEHFDNVSSGAVNLLEYYEGEEVDFIGATLYTKDPIIVIDNIFDNPDAGYTHLVNDDLYDTNGNKVWEFRITKAINFNYQEDMSDFYQTILAPLYVYFISKANAYNNYLTESGLGEDDTWYQENWNAGIFIGAFSTTIDLSDEEEILTNLLNLPLLRAKMSDCSYETVIEELDWGEMPAQSGWAAVSLPGMIQTEFMDEADAIYDSIPLQALDSRYHKTDYTTHAGIVKYFKELVDEFESAANKHPRLKKMSNQISFILEEYKTQPDLLVHLNRLRSVFPSKSTATPVGKLYKRFRKRITSANKSIKRGSKLSRQQVRNPKLKDSRSENVETYSTPSSAVSQDDMVATDYLYDSWPITIEYETTSDVYTSYGYYFFDYEKAVITTSAIAQAYDLNKLRTMYGLEIPYNSFQVVESRIQRCKYAPCTSGVQIISVMKDAYGSPGFPSTTEVICSAPSNGTTNTDMLVYPGTQGIDLYGVAASGTEAGFASNMPKLVVRPTMGALNKLAETGIANYRLLTFEFLDYWRGDYWNADTAEYDSIVSGDDVKKYGASVTIYDNTYAVANKMGQVLYDHLQSLREYLDVASDLCSANTSGEFNQFFTEAVLAIYEDEPTTAPWYTAPVVYAIYKDLVYDTFEGDVERINDYALAIVDNINPYNGMLPRLQTFYDQMGELFNILYSNTDESGNNNSLINSIFNGLGLDSDGARTLEYKIDLSDASQGVYWPEIITSVASECMTNGDCGTGYKCWDDATCVPDDYCEENSHCDTGYCDPGTNKCGTEPEEEDTGSGGEKTGGGGRTGGGGGKDAEELDLDESESEARDKGIEPAETKTM